VFLTQYQLATVKRRFDTTNLYRLNQSIPPAIDGPGP
jgi:hypothetical protein